MNVGFLYVFSSILINFITIITGRENIREKYPCIIKLHECIITSVNISMWEVEWNSCCNDFYSQTDSFNKTGFLLKVNNCANEKAETSLKTCLEICDAAVIQEMKQRNITDPKEWKFIENSAPEKPRDASHCENYVHKLMVNIKENCKKSKYFEEECKVFLKFHDKYKTETRNGSSSLFCSEILLFFMNILVSFGIIMLLQK